MIRTEIYIENQRLDLYKDISAEFTYNIDDIKDFSSRNTNFSKTIIIPGNATNNKLFGHIFEFGSANNYDPSQPNVGYNFNPSVSADCLVYIDKIQIFKGVLRLLEIVVDRGSIEYECAVFGELGGFISAVGSKRVEELDFSQYDHDWTIGNISGSWGNASGGAYYYPLIDYGKASANKHDFDVSTFRPAMFVREYIDKIITGCGYTYESDFFNSSLFKRLVIPNNQKQLASYSDISFVATFEIPQTQFLGSPSTAFPIVSTASTPNIGYFTMSNANTRYTYNGPSAITGTFEFNVGDAYHSAFATFEVRKNGTGGPTTSITTEYQGTTPGNFFISSTLTINPGDFIEFGFIWQDWITGQPLTVEYIQSILTFRTTNAQLVPLTYGNKVLMNATLPRGVFQKDFFASIVKMFNLYVIESTEKTKHLIITPFIDFYQTTPTFLQVNDLEEELLVDDNDLLILEDGGANFRDWTYKVDRSKPFRMKPMAELNGRYFEFKYKSDLDFLNDQYTKKYNQTYGDRIEDTGFQFANDKQTAEIIFAASPLIGYPGEEKVFTPIYKISNTQNTQSEDQTESTIRIMQIKQMDVSTSWVIKNGMTTISSSLLTYPYAGHLDDPDLPAADINFGAPKELFFTLLSGNLTANLFNGFWSDYIAEITDKNSKVMTCNVYLTEADIFTLDFSKLIWIDGSLWRLNKVIDYNPMVKDTTKCEFLKVIELTYT
jgi:hypothetical protein